MARYQRVEEVSSRRGLRGLRGLGAVEWKLPESPNYEFIWADQYLYQPQGWVRGETGGYDPETKTGVQREIYMAPKGTPIPTPTREGAAAFTWATNSLTSSADLPSSRTLVTPVQPSDAARIEEVTTNSAGTTVPAAATTSDTVAPPPAAGSKLGTMLKVGGGAAVALLVYLKLQD